MFEQPPITVREVFGRGFIQGFAVIFFSFVLTLCFSLPSKRWPWRPLSFHENLIAWPILCTIGCGIALATKDEKSAWFRGGVAVSYALFLLVIGALWRIKF